MNHIETFNAKQLSVAFFGRTGVGKTSTINRLFGLNWKVVHGKAATKKLTKKVADIQYEGQPYKILVIDTPGVAESLESDYLDIYKQAVETVKCIVWVFQADVRYFVPDQKALLQIDSYLRQDMNFVIGLNQIDLIHPENWDTNKNQPSWEQKENILRKMEIVRSKLVKYIPVKKITVVPYSSKKSYGLDDLVQQMISGQKEENDA